MKPRGQSKDALVHREDIAARSAKVEEQVWNDLRSMADESHQSISGLLTEAISEYVQKRRVRPAVFDHASNAIAANEALVKRLAE